MKLKVLLISIEPPANYCGIYVVLYRHLIERNPFELLVATNADYVTGPQPHLQLTLPYPIQRLKKSRFGPRLKKWIADFENLMWPLTIPRALDRAIIDYKPDVILTLAETGLCHIAAKAAKKYRLPLAGLFLDWFPIMQGRYGHEWARDLLSRRYRELYKQCDLAFCTSDGMQEVLGKHSNSHVMYPIPGRHQVSTKSFPPLTGKFRLAYVGSVENFYGRMICSLIEKIEPLPDIEIVVVGPNADWPADILQRAKAKGSYLGFKPPEEAAEVLVGADALLVVMSFEKEHRFFMETSFTTKFLDYCAFNKPIILWGPGYCCPVKMVQARGGAYVVNQPEAGLVTKACSDIASDTGLRDRLIAESARLHQTVFNPERLQNIFVREIEKLATGYGKK